MDRRIGYALAWVVAAVVAISVGLAAVSTVGASIRGRGPLGNEVVRDNEQPARPDPEAARVRDEVSGEFGTFVVECRGVFAYGIRVEPDAANRWRVVSYEEGPDDDVDAVFSNGRRSVDLEVYCSRGKPTVAEIESNTLPDDDDLS
ncbi:MAG: hypothetical protein ABWX84_09080 [Nocardioides sp.]